MGQRPVLRAMLTAEAADRIQWRLYYPAVLHLDELELSEEARGALRESLAAYEAGDLKTAAVKYPSDRDPTSVRERVFKAGLWLSIGRLAEVEELAQSLQRDAGERGFDSAMRAVIALQKVVAGAKFQVTTNAPAPPKLATEWLAESYYQQSQNNLDAALFAATKAVGIAPAFGFGWTRVAELELSFGRTDAATVALEKALHLSPRNAQALSLKGFLLAGRNRNSDALTYFNKAVAIDGSLANAWLGQGLCRVRRGDLRGGLDDLQTAAVLEPNRSLLHSYLGKALSDQREKEQALKEFRFAKDLDSNDPTLRCITNWKIASTRPLTIWSTPPISTIIGACTGPSSCWIKTGPCAEPISLPFIATMACSI